MHKHPGTHTHTNSFSLQHHTCSHYTPCQALSWLQLTPVCLDSTGNIETVWLDNALWWGKIKRVPQRIKKYVIISHNLAPIKSVSRHPLANVTEHVIGTPLQFLIHKMSQHQNMKTKGSRAGRYKGFLNISCSLTTTVYHFVTTGYSLVYGYTFMSLAFQERATEPFNPGRG